MRLFAWTLAALLAVCVGVPGQASASVTVKEKTVHYRISGVTGVALLKAMDRRGPKHGFRTRAIAQTSYSPAWTIEWRETAKDCRVERVSGVVSVTYTFPQAADALSPGMNRRWRAFMAGVTKHERMHGKIATQMARAVEKSISRLKISNDPGCRKARRETKRRMAEIYADYERKQYRFDALEHREGGKVERLIDALVLAPGV
jgi:predicted secreted Zn-dependent protease